MTMNPLYPCGKPCSGGTHNETVKNLALLTSIVNEWNYDGITALNHNPVGVFSVLYSNRKFYHIYTVTIVIHKSRNLVGTVRIAKVGPKKGHVFQSNNMSLCLLKRNHQVKEHRETRDSLS